MNKFWIKNYLYSFPWFFFLFIATFSINNPGQHMGQEEHENYLKAIIIFLYTVSLILLLFNFQKIFSILKGRWLYIFFLLYISVSAAWSDDPASTLRISAYFWGGAVVCLMAVLAFANNPEKFFQILIFYSILMVGGSLIAIFLIPTRGVGEGGRWIGLTAHANTLGVVSIISVWANISYFQIAKRKYVKAFNIFMIFLSAVCLYGANSATSIVLSIVIIVLTLILWSFDAKRVTRLFAQIAGMGFFVLLCFSILYVLMPEIFSINAMFKMIGRNQTFTGRTGLWEMGMLKFFQEPIIGSGFQDFINISGTKIKHFHNGYIELLVRGGVIALLFLIVFVFQSVFSLKRVSSSKLYVFFSIMVFAILVHNVTEGSFGRGVNALWLIFSFIYFYKSHNARAQWRPVSPPLSA